MKCKDQSTTFLKSFGYNVIRLPKADIAPLQIYIRTKGDLEPLGNLVTVIKPIDGSTDFPPISKDIAAAFISGKKTSNLSAGLGLDILGNIIGAMGGSKLGLETSYKNARTISFTYENVTEDSIEIARLDQYLSGSDIDPMSKHIGELLDADDVFVLSSVIKSNSIKVEAQSSHNTNIEIDVPVIKEMIGGNIKVGADGEKASTVTFTGNIPLVFGFKAVRLFYEDGNYKRFDPVQPGSIAASVAAGVDSSFALLSDDGLVKL